MNAEHIRGERPAANTRYLIFISVAALALVLATPSQCQTDRESSLADLFPNSTQLAFASGPQHNSGAVCAPEALLDSAGCALQEEQSEQEEAPSADAAAPAQAKTSGEDATNQNAQPNAQRGTSNDRLFKVLPNFLTLENAGQLPPLTAGEKFEVVARGTFDYVQLPWYGLLAGLSQAENSEPGYGHGAVGYGKRYGAYAADGTIENFMVGAVFSSLLRQDPRFYQSSNGRPTHRLGYAVSRIFITRSDAGGEQFNYSEIFGSAVSAGISTYSYHPRADRTLSNTASVWGSQIAYDTISLVIKEFWPDIRKITSHKLQPEATKP